nr:MAG TPA: hypothetical protein [Caudoviricetes sp.]
MASTNFINECKNRANANRLGQIVADGIDTPISQSNNLQIFEIDSGCYVDGNIIGSVYAKCLKASFIADQNNLVDKSIQAQIGVKYADLNSEYINVGKYTVERPNNEITTQYSQITAYDSLYTNLDSKYVCNIDYSKGNITLKDLYADVCTNLVLTPKSLEFINSTIPISDNPFTNGETNRTVLQTIAKISCSFVDIDNDTNEIDLCWLSQDEEPDYIFYKNDYSSVEGGQVVCGPINCLIIKNSQIDDENVTIKDTESIELNGEHSITISEDYILYDAELRQQAINGIWNRIKGMKYVDCKLTTYYGKPFLKLGDRIRIYINDTEYIDTYVLKHNFTYDGSFTSIIESPALTEQEIKTKQDISLGQALANTQVEVNKQKKTITSLVEETKDNTNKIAQTITNINNIQNLFQITGGNNLIKNSVGLFENENWIESEEGTFEYGEDSELIGVTTSISKITVSNGTLTTSNENIVNLTLNEIKTLSFKIKQDSDTTTTITLWGLNKEQPLYTKIFTDQISYWTEIYDEQLNQFYADSSNLYLEIKSESQYGGKFYISDLILNNGDKTEWSLASGEVNGTIVKLSQLGISVYAIEGNYVTMMTTEGLQIRSLVGTSVGNVITQFIQNGLLTIDIEQTGKHIQKNLVHDVINSNGHEVYVEYIKG